MSQDEPLALAQSLYEQGQYQEAEHALLDMLAEDTTNLSAYSLLARIEYALKNPVRESRALERAVALGDGDPQHLKRLGSLYARQGEWESSARQYQRAIELTPDDLAAYHGLVQARFALQDLSSVEELVGELKVRFPDAALTYLLAGHLNKATGDTSAARTSYARALEIEPTLGEAIFGIVDLGLSTDDKLKTQAESLASRDDLSAADAINAGFAHARILDQAGEYAEAFKHFQRSNKVALDDLAKHGITYEPERIEQRVDQTLEDHPAGSFKTLLDPLPIDLLPIFVVGLPRSGTTLLEQILAAHPDVQAGGELIIARECEQRFRDQRREAGRTGPVDPSNETDAGMLEEARERYVDAIFERDLDGPWIVDKLPANFEIAGFLRLMFPNAPIIHSVRDARATGFSLYTANFGAHEPYYHSLEHLAHYCRQYQRLMEHWRKVVPGPFVDIRYEDLVRDPDNQIPALLQSVGLSPHPDCLAFYDHRRPILTASHAQVRRPVYTSAIEHWRHYEPWLGPLMEL